MQLFTSEGPLPTLRTTVPGFLSAQQIPFAKVSYLDAQFATWLMQSVELPHHRFWHYQFNLHQEQPASLQVSQPRVLLHYMLSGRGLCLHKTGHKEWIKPDRYYLFCVPPGRHDMHFPTGDYTYAQLELSPLLLTLMNFPQDTQQIISEFHERPGIFGVELFAHDIPDTVRHTLLAIKKTGATKREAFEPAFISNFMTLFNAFNEDLEKGEYLFPIDETEKRVNKICRYIKSYRGIVTIEELCKEFATCETNLSKLFADHLGTTVQFYMLNARIKEAQYLLLTTNMRVLDIAEAVNYQSPSGFCKAFRRISKMTPTQFRKEFK